MGDDPMALLGLEGALKHYYYYYYYYYYYTSEAFFTSKSKIKQQKPTLSSGKKTTQAYKQPVRGQATTFTTPGALPMHACEMSTAYYLLSDRRGLHCTHAAIEKRLHQSSNPHVPPDIPTTTRVESDVGAANGSANILITSR
jgi:hypothetical protein